MAIVQIPAQVPRAREDSKLLELELSRGNPTDQENAEKLARYRNRYTAPELDDARRVPCLFPELEP